MEPTKITDFTPSFEDWSDSALKIFFRIRVLLKRFWWILLLCMSLGMAYKATQELTKPPQYRSNAEMILSGNIRIQENAVWQEERSQFFGTQLEMMTSPQVRNNARALVQAKHPNVPEGSVHLHAEMKPGANIFLLQVTGSEPKYTQLYLDACMEAYQNLRKEHRSENAEDMRLIWAKQLAELEVDIQTIENDLVEFQKTNNMDFVQEQGSTAGAYLAQLRKRMADLQTQLRFHQGLSPEDLLAQAEGQSPNDFFSLNQLDFSESYIQAQEELDLLKVEYRGFAKYLKPKHPKMLRLVNEIERMQSLLELYRERSFDELETQRKNLETKIANLEVIIEEWSKTALEASQRLAEFRRMQSRLERHQKRYDQILNNLQDISSNVTIEREKIEVFVPAQPAYKVAVKVWSESIKGLFMGGLIGFGFIYFIGSLDRRVVSSEDIKAVSDQPVLGIIPRQDFDDERAPLMNQLKSSHGFAESFRTLRSSFLFQDRKDSQSRVFITTSALPEEGKSTIASNLSVSLALASHRTLLIDGDMRRGFLHRTFGVTRSPGLCELLQGKVSLDDIMHRTEVDNLYFISCGESHDNIGELLLANRNREILDVLKDTFEYIIIDTAPILATDDTTSFAPNADAVLFVTRSNKVRVRQVRMSVENLTSRGAKLYGFILNFADTKGMDYYYYSKYHYYYNRREDGDSPKQITES